jgi:predicted SnoaL-like aldol condensation-catalyzing enzyme
MTYTHRNLLGGIVALLVIGGTPIAAQSSGAQGDKNQKLATTWYREVVVMGHVSDAAKYMADDFVDHDPRVLGGRSAFVQHYENASARPAEAKEIATFAQGDYVAMVWQRADKDPKSSTPYMYTTYDLVRIKNGKIQEHWDNAKKNTQWK